MIVSGNYFISSINRFISCNCEGTPTQSLAYTYIYLLVGPACTDVLPVFNSSVLPPSICPLPVLINLCPHLHRSDRCCPYCCLIRCRTRWRDEEGKYSGWRLPPRLVHSFQLLSERRSYMNKQD